MSGANPLHWDCAKQGCFNVKKRPKIEQLAECLPRRCKFGDVDGLAEVNGFGLLLEWKTSAIELPTGQRIAYEKLTRNGVLAVLVVAGNAETMEAHASGRYFRGRWSGWTEGDLDDVKTAIRKWVKWAETSHAG